MVTRNSVNAMAQSGTESWLAGIWQREVRGRAGLSTVGGLPVAVLYQGRRSGRGPDFRNAALVLNGALLIGDVELHLLPQQWRQHGHHRDARYNGVVLQVVLSGGEATVRREDGQQIPVLPLAAVALAATGTGAEGRCPLRVTGPEIGHRLDLWGERRFQLKAAAQWARAQEVGAGQALYEGIMEALGYPANREGFLHLARSLPLSHLESSARGRPALEQAAGLVSCLLGGARGWRWRTGGIRPVNHPQHRLRAMGHLLARFVEPGLLPGIATLLARCGSPRGLARGLTVAGRPALLGTGRAGIIAVNVLLPFFFSLTVRPGTPCLRLWAWALYRDWPPLEENEVTRHVRDLLGLAGAGPGRVVDSAQRQQGLLHLYHGYCSAGSCPRCPLSAQGEVGDDVQPPALPTVQRQVEEAAGGDHGRIIGAEGRGGEVEGQGRMLPEAFP